MNEVKEQVTGQGRSTPAYPYVDGKFVWPRYEDGQKVASTKDWTKEEKQAYYDYRHHLPSGQKVDGNRAQAQLMAALNKAHALLRTVAPDQAGLDVAWGELLAAAGLNPATMDKVSA